MTIYEFDTQDNQAYLFTSSQISRLCRPSPPRSLVNEWNPPIFELVRDDEYRSNLPKTDFPTFTIATIVLSRRAVERLRPVIDTCGEVLPIYLSNDHDILYLFNVTRIINAVDMKRSEFLRFPDGGIMKWEKLIFDPQRIPTDATFFKTTQLGPVTEIYATEAAVEAVQKSGLTGYEFRLAWSNE